MSHSTGKNDGVRLMNADDAYAAMAEKLQCRYNSVRKSFAAIKGAASDAQLSRSEFRQFLRHTGIELTGEEFGKLWKKFDTTGDGRLSYAEVQTHFGAFISPPGQSLLSVMSRPMTPTVSPQKQAALARAMRKKIHDIESVFKQLDTDGSGRISLPEFIQAMRRLGLKLSDEECGNLMHRFVHSTTGEMVLDEFKECVAFFLNMPASAAAEKDEKDDAIRVVEADLKAKLGTGEAGGEALAALFKPFDTHGRGEITLSEMRAALERCLGAPLRPVTYKSLCGKYDPDDVGAFLYLEWAETFSGGEYRPKIAEEEARVWVEVPALHDFGVRPIINLVTRKPYTAEELVKRVAPIVGMPECEVRMCLWLLGKKSDLTARLAALDVRQDGFLRDSEIRDVLEQMGLIVGDDLIAQIQGRCEKNADGKLSYHDIIRRISPFINPSAGMLEKMMLEKDPNVMKTRERLSKRATQAPVASPSTPRSAAAAAQQQSPAGAEQPGSNTKRAFVAAAHDDADRQSVATGAVDLAPTMQRMRRVLGASWPTLLSDVSKSSGGDGLVSGSILRDALASKGIALTSKELRALSMRYHGAGPAVTRDGDSSGVVDVPALFEDAFATKAAPGGGAASPSKTAAMSRTAGASLKSPLAASGTMSRTAGGASSPGSSQKLSSTTMAIKKVTHPSQAKSLF